MSIWNWLLTLFSAAIVGAPVMRILHRAGFSRWWVLLCFMPLLNLIGLWIFAFTTWPLDAATSNFPPRK
jgi:hypothetical protein